MQKYNWVVDHKCISTGYKLPGNLNSEYPGVSIAGFANPRIDYKLMSLL